jgi:hypothetical protein
MMRLNYKKTAIIQFALATLTMITLTRHASAQEPAAPDPAAAPAPAAEEAPAPASRYPRGVIDRPLTLPAGLAMLGADFIALNKEFDVILGAPIVGYGITDDFEVQVPYTFTLKEFEAKGTLNLELGYKILRGAAGGKLEMIARARPGYDFVNELAAPILLGLHVQYNATPQFAIISGIPGTEQLKITVDGASGAAKPIDFSLPLGLGFQATPELYFELDTKIATINISDSKTTSLGDFAPVAVTAVFNAIPALDVQAQIFTDLANTPDETLGFLVGFRYYAGAL